MAVLSLGLHSFRMVHRRLFDLITVLRQWPSHGRILRYLCLQVTRRQVCAGDSAAIFTVSGHDNPACFALGTGMALPKQAPEKGWTLQLSTGHAHNYYDTSRTVNGKRYRAVYLNEIQGRVRQKRYFLVFSLTTTRTGKSIGKRLSILCLPSLRVWSQ